MTKREKVKFRIAVGSPVGCRSSVWRGSSTGDDVYVSHSNMGRIEKFSFHKSLICRLAFHEPENEKTDRAIKKWRRLPTAPSGNGRLAYVMTVNFPRDTLPMYAHKPEKKPVKWITPAPIGYFTCLEFVFTQESEASLRKIAMTANREIIYYLRLPGGDAFTISAVTAPWDGEDFIATAELAGEDFYVVSRDDPKNTGRPVALTLFNLSKTGDVMHVWEHGAYRAQKDTKFPKPMGRLIHEPKAARKFKSNR